MEGVQKAKEESVIELLVLVLLVQVLQMLSEILGTVCPLILDQWLFLI